jgi:hypothetical protein
MREKDDGANSNVFRWTPDVARKAAVAGGVERLHAPLTNNESTGDKWVVSQAVNDTSMHRLNAVACASRKEVMEFDALRLAQRTREIIIQNLPGTLAVDSVAAEIA